MVCEPPNWDLSNLASGAASDPEPSLPSSVEADATVPSSDQPQPASGATVEAGKVSTLTVAAPAEETGGASSTGGCSIGLPPGPRAPLSDIWLGFGFAAIAALPFIRRSKETKH